MNVLLTEEASNELRKFIFHLAIEEIERAKQEAALYKRVLNQKEIAERFGVSTTTIREWETLGLPHGSMGAKSKFYDFEECRLWVLSQKR
jgi:DNA-directed RNA polymerase specialized sigma24 family protein